MGRHKATRIPFLRVKIKSETIFSVLSLFSLLACALSLFAFTQNATVLNNYRQWMQENFGKGALFFPFLFLFFAGMLVQQKKLKLIKPQWFIGYLLFFVSFITLFATGSIGQLISENVGSLISRPGTTLTFLVILIAGLFIAFELSLHEFLHSVVQLVSIIADHAKQLLQKPKGQVFVKESKSKGKDEFVIAPFQDKLPMVPDKQKTILTKDQMVKQQIIKQDPFIKSAERKLVGGSVEWKFPSLDLLDSSEGSEADRGDVKSNSDTIEKTLDSFGIRAKVADINYGPAITQYAIQIAMGINLNKVITLSNNLALALAAPNGQIRIEAPIPGKALVGIEVPNIRSQVVTLRHMLQSPVFTDRTKLLMVPMGIDVSGNPITIEINKMPHVLVAGTTGSGKSVMLTAWITTILLRTTPDEVRFILIDPKRVTFMMFEGIPHLLTNVITDPRDTVSALKWAVNEMEDRYKKLSEAKCRDIYSFNESVITPEERMPFVVIIIDELADLMMYASKEVEDSITRIAQKARAIGIYLVIATQRPSVDVITGLMKANIPARLAFNVSSMIDSRVILDMPGAEKLLGKGDMLFMSPESSKPKRIQGPFVSEEETKNVVEFLKAQVPVIRYTEEVIQQPVKSMVDSSGNVTLKTQGRDALFNDVVQFVCETKKASASLLQRKFSIGYSRAARILDELQEAGVVGAADSSKPREILISSLDELQNK